MRQRARSEGDKEERSEALLASALGLFPRLGYAKTTIEGICAEAGLSPGSFYRYFGSKLEIYRILTARGTGLLKARLGAALAQEGQGSPERLAALASAYLAFFREEGNYYRIIAVLHLGQGEFFEDLALVPGLEEAARSLLGLLAGIIQVGQAADSFGPGDPWKTAVALWGMMDGIFMLEIKASTGFVGASLEDLLETMVDLVISGLRP